MQRTNWNIKQSTFDQDQNIFSTLPVQIIIYSTANNNSNETKKSILMGQTNLFLIDEWKLLPHFLPSLAVMKQRVTR